MCSASAKNQKCRTRQLYLSERTIFCSSFIPSLARVKLAHRKSVWQGGGGWGERKKTFDNNIYLCEVVRLQILVSPKVCFQTRRKAAACVCACACACVRVPGSCTGPQGQACVDWVSSTHSSLVESERNPHRWLSTFKKSRLRETCQLRFKFLLLVAVTLQYSSNICLSPPTTHRQPNPTHPLHPQKILQKTQQPADI